MQNNDKGKSFAKKIREKGYYIVLILCVAAVGVSGYLFCKSLATEKPVSPALDDVGISAALQPTAATAATAEKVVKPYEEPAVEVGGNQEDFELPQLPAVSDKLSVVLPVNGALTQSYCVDHLAYNPTMKDWRTHEGIDLEAPLGAAVCAVADGKVEKVYSDDFWGQTIVLSHAGGYETHYSNLAEEVSVSVGDSVSAGDTIGHIGATAIAESGQEPHLHLSVFKNNVSVDPESLLP